MPTKATKDFLFPLPVLKIYSFSSEALVMVLLLPELVRVLNPVKYQSMELFLENMPNFLLIL